MSTLNHFNWKAFAKFHLEELDFTLVPLNKDGTQPWDNWEKLKGKKITDDDLDRWIEHENFGGFAGLFGKSHLPMSISPTVEELKKVDPFAIAFSTLSPEDIRKKTEWRSIVTKINQLQKNARK